MKQTIYGHRKAIAQEMASTWQGVGKVLARCWQALSSLLSMLRVWLEYAKEQLRSSLGAGKSMPKACLRYAACLLLLMVVGVNVVEAQLPTVTTDANSPTYYLIQSAQIPSFYMIPYSTTNNVSTSNVPCADMRWYFMASGETDYYYIRHNTSGEYLSCTDGAIQLEDLSESTPGDSHKFSIEAIDDYYYIKPKGASASYVTKANGNANPTDYVKASTIAEGAHSQWKFVASNAIPKPVPFELSPSETKSYYKIRNVSYNTHYLSINTETSKVNTSSVASDDMVWYFKEAGSDDYLKYYYILHAATNQYICYDGTTQTASLQDKTTENEEACQFVIVQAARTEGSGSRQKVVECYAMIPKSLKTELWGNNSIALTDTQEGTNVCILNDRTDTYIRAHWTFEPVDCADPVIAFDESTGVTITSATTGASIYYTTATGTTTPADPTTGSTQYNGTPFTPGNGVTTIKAIAVKGYGNSSIVTKTFIKPTITLATSSFTYDGTAKEPTPTVKIGDTAFNTTTYGNYVVRYENNINAGTATVIVREAKGNTNIIYGTQTFTITAKAMTINSGANLAAGFSVVVKSDNDLVLYDGNKELVAADYEVVSSSTSGEVTTKTIHPKGNYSGDNITFSYISGITFHTDAVRSEWSATYVASEDYALPDENVNAYIITGIQDDWAIAERLAYIPSGVPVLVVSFKETHGFLVGTPSGEAPDCSANLLKVRNAALADVLAGKIYWLYNNEFVLNAAGTIPAGKVYLNPNNLNDSQLTDGGSGGSAPRRLQIRLGGDTGMTELQNDRTTGTGNDTWYAIDGRKLNGKPSERGLYITNGRKIMVK